MTWVDAVRSVMVGIADEAAPGIIDSDPQEYIYTTTEAVLEPIIEQDTLQSMDERGITFIVDRPYHVVGNIASWAFPEDNGFGQMLRGAFGSASATYLASGCYIHRFDVVDTRIPSHTIWMKTKTFEVTGTNCQIHKLTVKNSKASILDYSADIIGSQLATSTTFGTATYATSSAKVFRSGGARIYWGDILSSNVDDVIFVIDNSVDPQDAKALGDIYANHILAGDRTVSGDMTIFIESTRELKDFWGSETGPILNKDKIPIMMIWESASILSSGTTVGATVKLMGDGTPTLTTGGLYSGSLDYSFYEVKIVEASATDSMMWRKNGGDWSDSIELITGAISLEDGVTIEFSDTTGNTTADRWFFYAGEIPYAFIVYMPSVNINSFAPSTVGSRLSAKVSYTAETNFIDGIDFEAVAFLINTQELSYGERIISMQFYNVSNSQYLAIV